MHGQVNELSAMRCCRYLTPIDARIGGTRIFQPYNPIVSVRRMEGLKTKVSGIRVAAHSQKARVLIANPGDLQMTHDSGAKFNIIIPATKARL